MTNFHNWCTSQLNVPKIRLHSGIWDWKLISKLLKLMCIFWILKDHYCHHTTKLIACLKSGLDHHHHCVLGLNIPNNNGQYVMGYHGLQGWRGWWRGWGAAQSILRLKAEPHLWSELCHAGRYLNVFTKFTTSQARMGNIVMCCKSNKLGGATTAMAELYLPCQCISLCAYLTGPTENLSCFPIFWLYEKIVFALEIKIKLKFFYVGWQNNSQF